jgi:transposase
MQDRELYRRILGIETPWYVESVELKLDAGEVHVYLAHHQGIEWPCPECAAPSKLHDHQPERQWRHLDTCQYRTILHAQPPRSECPEHGVRVAKLPWAEPAARFTALFEALAIHWLQAASQSAVAGLLNLSWDEIHGILERAVKRGLERRQAEPVAQIGVDEKAFRKGHKYLTLVNDLARGRVLYVAEDRKQSSLDGFWQTLTAEQTGAIEVVAMDMWDPYVGRQDRLRQVPHRPASGEGGGPGAAQGEQSAAGGGGRHAGGDALRLAAASGADGARGPQGVPATAGQRIEDGAGVGLERNDDGVFRLSL